MFCRAFLPSTGGEASNCRFGVLNDPGSRARSRTAPERKKDVCSVSLNWVEQLMPPTFTFEAGLAFIPQTDPFPRPWLRYPHTHTQKKLVTVVCGISQDPTVWSFRSEAPPPSRVCPGFGHCYLASTIWTTELIKTSRLRLKKDCASYTNRMTNGSNLPRAVFGKALS